MTRSGELQVRVADVATVAENIKHFRLQSVDGSPLPPFSGGSHIVVSMNHEARRIRNPYSLMGSTLDRSHYEITVLKTVDSRGGSTFMHDWVTPGTQLIISHPVNLFPIDHRGRKHILIAGGIGITPLIPMAEQLALWNRPFELHYAMRDAARGAHAERLKATFGERVQLYRNSEDERIPVASLLERQPLGTHLYVCGPERMIEAVLDGARAAGWPNENVHAERFVGPPGGAPFLVRLARAGITVEVGEHQSVLEAIEAAGVEPPYLCRGGACGQCETTVVSCDGSLLHNDHYLSPRDRESGIKIMICVSRLRGRELVVDL
jgi:dimethylamine monooxygenase subunit B